MAPRISTRFRKASVPGTLATAMLLAGCTSSGSGDETPVDDIKLSGVVSTPGGQLAFLGPSLQDKLLAAFFGRSAAAAVITGVDAVAGATVELYEVDKDGAAVGDPLATATTGSDGSYSLTLPTGFAADTKYVVRVKGQTDTLEARVASTDDDVDIDPVSTASSAKITTITTAANVGLAAISAAEAALIDAEFQNVALQLDDTATTGKTLAQLISLANTAIGKDEEANNIINSVGEGQSICGNVVDSAAQPLENILVVARDYGNWVTRANTRTDSNGDYCINVPAGDYVLGALNFTGASTAASEWWSATGDKYAPIDAEKLTVTAGTNTTGKDFALEPGARIAGKVTASGGALDGKSLRGVRITLRNFRTFFPYASVRTKPDGSYRINVIPGDYVLEARNETRQPYGSAVFKSGKADGTRNRNKGSKVTLTAGTTTQAGFALTRGHLVYGQLLDNNTTAVTGQRVRFNPLDASFGTIGTGVRLRTNNEGKYRVWLKPGNYSIDAYGQRGTNLSLPQATDTVVKEQVNFTAQIGKLTATLKDSSGNPVSQAKVDLYYKDATTGTITFIGNSVSNADGSVEMASDTAGDHIIAVTIDDGRDYGSIIYDGIKKRAAGTLVPVTLGSSSATGDIVLPAGGALEGAVTNADGTTGAAERVQVRNGGNSSDFVFVATRTHGDGSYVLSLPAATYNRVRAGQANGTNADGVVITAGQTTTQDFTLLSILGDRQFTGTAEVYLSLNSDGTFSFNEVTGTTPNGLETGTFSYTATTLTFTIENDGNVGGGLGNAGETLSTLYSVSGDKLTFLDDTGTPRVGDGGEPLEFTLIP